MRSGTGQTLEVGQRLERKIHFAGRAAVFVTTDAIEKIRRQLAGFEKFLEGEMRVDTRRDDAGRYFFPALQSHAARAPVFNKDFRNGSLRANFDARLASRTGDSVGDGSGAATAKAPGAERAINFAHVVMQKNVCRAR